MLSVIYALGPVFLLILLGQGLKRSRFVSDAFWPAAEKITYFVTFPALLIGNLARADLAAFAWEAIAASIIVATLAAGFLVLVLERSVLCANALPMGRATTSSAFQGAIRPNTYVGLAGAAALFGNTGTTITALCIAATVPLVNVMAVSALTRMVPRKTGVGLLAILWGIVKNPIILACTVGIALNILDWPLPPIVGPLVDILGRAALPVGLLAVGAGLSLRVYGLEHSGHQNRQFGPILIPLLCAGFLKLVFLPLAAGLLLIAISVAAPLFGGTSLDGATIGTVILWAGLPSSASAYVLARQMGGDAPMMAAIITWQTVAAMITLSLLMGGLFTVGIL